LRKKKEEHVNLERWLVSYADFITLMFAFFVIMYAVSQADMEKFKKFSVGLRNAFAGSPNMIQANGSANGNAVNLFEALETPGGRVPNLPAGKINVAADPDPELQEVHELLEETISLDLGVKDSSVIPQLMYDSRGLVIRIAAKNFFDDSQSKVKIDMQPVLDRIGEILSHSKRLIRVEGHVDIDEAVGISGWKLSSDRAIAVTQQWMQKFHFDPARLGVAGYSSFHPLAQGRDPLSRAKNRRVEIIVLNNRFSE
jgi:chemotaxis protein MotB